MALDNKNILIPYADQSTTGAAFAGAVVATVPTDYDSALTALANLTATGYLGEDGIQLTTTLSTTDFKEMNRGTVRKGLDDFTGTITYAELQLMDEAVLARKFGAANVTTTAATTTAGKKIHVKIGSELPPIQTFAFKLKDGDAKAILWVNSGQVTNGVDITFSPNSMASLPMEVSCFDDGTGYSVHLFFDDGRKASA